MHVCLHPPERPTAVFLHVVLRSFTLIWGQMQLCSNKAKTNTREFDLLANCRTTLDSCVIYIWGDICGEDCILTVFAEDRRGDEVLEDPSVSVEWTNHLTPNQELTHMLCQLPQFLLRHSDNRLVNVDTRLTKSIWVALADPLHTQKPLRSQCTTRKILIKLVLMSSIKEEPRGKMYCSYWPQEGVATSHVKGSSPGPYYCITVERVHRSSVNDHTCRV